jgi:hypothetical protein
MIGHILRLARHHVYQLKNKSKRSSRWPEVEYKYKENNPECACCGSKNKLQIHHKKPFHLHPELELDPTNLITLCMDLDCHILVGHGDNFKMYNPDVVEDAAIVRKSSDIKGTLKIVAASAKSKRLSQ